MNLELIYTRLTSIREAATTPDIQGPQVPDYIQYSQALIKAEVATGKPLVDLVSNPAVLLAADLFGEYTQITIPWRNT